jgi:hypothetical protein
MPFGGGFVEATIVEDNGNLGKGGKRLYGVCYTAAPRVFPQNRRCLLSNQQT